MPEFLTLLPPDEARTLLLSHLSYPISDSERIDVPASLGRITAENIIAPQPLPDFQRSTVDGYAVRARDTYGATDPVEFFAVSVEAFFERPRALRTNHPNLYAELQKYFRQDPVEYSAEPADVWGNY